MSRVIFLKSEDRARRDGWARQWATEGHDRVLVDPAAICRAINPRFVSEVHAIAVATCLNVIKNAIRLGRHVCINVDTRHRAGYQRLESVARQFGGDVQWLEL